MITKANLAAEDEEKMKNQKIVSSGRQRSAPRLTVNVPTYRQAGKYHGFLFWKEKVKAPNFAQWQMCTPKKSEAKTWRPSRAKYKA